MAIIDLQGFFSDMKEHVSGHGFHVHDERHYLETYSNRQMWEVDLHPDNACGGPLDMVMTLEAEARTLIAFEDEVAMTGPDGQPHEDLTIPLGFGFMLPPLVERPDPLVLAVDLGEIGGVGLPLSVSTVRSLAALADRPECTINIASRIDVPLAHVYNRQDIDCDLIDRAHDVCEFLLDRAPAWMGES